MASSQGDVRSSPMAYPAVRSLCQNSRYLSGQRRGLPPRRQLPVRPEHDRAQSCAIALRSPASERPSDSKRYSPDIHLTTFSGARDGVLVAVAAVKTRRILARTPER
eukprot:scaffold20650_cov74-Phaeocystis_antarctica.AAC.1